MTTETKARPHEIRRGRIKAAIFTHESDYGARYTVKLEELIAKEDEGRTQWQSTEYISGAQLLRAKKVLDLADDWIAEQSAKPED